MISSTPQNRSAARLVLLVAEEHVETNPAFVRHDIDGDGKNETFCNAFAARIAVKMGVPLPLLLANAQHQWLVEQAAKSAPRASGLPVGWEKVDAHTAQAMADQGCFAVASWANPIEGGHGHIAPLMPSLGEPGVWAAQAGRLNFTRELLQRGFGAIAPDFFVYP